MSKTQDGYPIKGVCPKCSRCLTTKFTEVYVKDDQGNYIDYYNERRWKRD